MSEVCWLWPDQFKRVDGVLGLAGAGAGPGNVFELLYRGGFVEQDLFGMCLAAGNTSNGTFTIGGVDTRLYTGEIAWAPDVGGSGVGGLAGLYQQQLAGIAVGKTVLNGSAFQQVAILDSGTNVLLLPSPLWQPVAAAFRAHCTLAHGQPSLKGLCGLRPGTKGLLDGGCVSMTDAEMAEFPTLRLGITAGGLEMPPSSYLRRDDPRTNPGQVCFGVRDTGDGGYLIIGDTTMENYFVAFDRANKRIGWAKRTDACGSV
eukprot:SAG22_NODE_41_length_25488_cov_6.133719_10_plen_259_part_00